MAAIVTPTSTGISSPSDSLIIASSTSSLSSSGFDFVSVNPKSLARSGSAGTNLTTTPVHPGRNPQPGEESSFSDDDEIVWGVSESEDLEGSSSGLGAVLSDDDFVLLSRTRTPASASRTRTRTFESTVSQAGTIRGVPLNSRLTEPHPSLSYPQATDVAIEAARDANDRDVIASELAKELAKLSVNTESLVGEASGTITPVRETAPAIHGALPMKKGKKKKERTAEEEALRKQRRKERKERKKTEKTPEELALRKQRKKERKERKKTEKTPEELALRKQRKEEQKEQKAREKEAKEAKRALEKDEKITTKGSKDEHKGSKHRENSIAMPAPNSKFLLPIVPELLKSASTATLVSSSNADVNHAALKEEVTPVVTLVPLPSPPLEPVKAPVTSRVFDSPKKSKKAKKAKAAEALPSSKPNTTTAAKVSEQHDKSTPTPYDEAVSYITSYISNASAHHNSICHLTLLQSLIIELGLIKDVSLLPRSIKAAKKFIKLRVFLNVKEYLKKRHEGRQVVQGLMFTSRSALVKDMRQKKNYAPLKWIKKHGLQDLLVGVFHH